MDWNRDDNPLLEKAQVGVEAEAFLHSPLGEHLQQRANEELDELTLQLFDADPDDRETNRQLRRRIHRVRDALQWLLEAVSDGEQAILELEREEQEALN